MLCTSHALKHYVTVAALHEDIVYSHFEIQLVYFLSVNLYLISELDSFEHSFISYCCCNQWSPREARLSQVMTLQDCVPNGSLPATLIG